MVTRWSPDAVPCASEACAGGMAFYERRLSPASVLEVPQQNLIPITGGKTQKINDVAVPCQVHDLPSVEPHIEPVAKTRIALPIQSRQVSLQFVLLLCRRQIVKPGKRCPVHD